LKNSMAKDIEHESLRLEIKGVMIQNEANFDLISRKLTTIEKNVSETLNQAKITNGRVTILESDIKNKADNSEVDNFKKEIEFFSMIKRKKWLIIVMVIALLKVYESLPNIETIIKWITTLF